MKQKTNVRKFCFCTKNNQDKDYGPEAQDPVDIEVSELLKQCEEKLKCFQKTQSQIQEIEAVTVGQHDNELYNLHRNDRLTASQFGMVNILNLVIFLCCNQTQTVFLFSLGM